MVDRMRSAELRLLIDVLRVASNRDARDHLLRFVAGRFSLGPRELERRIPGLSHASVSRILRGKQGRGESGARAVAALKRWARSRRSTRG